MLSCSTPRISRETGYQNGAEGGVKRAADEDVGVPGELSCCRDAMTCGADGGVDGGGWCGRTA